MDLFIINNIASTSQPCRGTINLKWPGVFYLCIYLSEGKPRAHWDSIDSFSSEGFSSELRKQSALIYSVILWLREAEAVKSDLWSNWRYLHLLSWRPPKNILPSLHSKTMLNILHKILVYCIRQIGSIIFSWASWVALCAFLAGGICCCSMTPLPDTGLLWHDRGRVIVRPQGHLIRRRAPQPAAITHVLDGFEPERRNLSPRRTQQLKQSSKSPMGIDQNIWMPFFSCEQGGFSRVPIVPPAAACQRRYGGAFVWLHKRGDIGRDFPPSFLSCQLFPC